MREMKDSGIEWVGQVPNNWKLKKGKYLFKQHNNRGNLKCLQLLSPSQKFGVIPQTLLEELTTQNVVKVSEKANLNDFKTVHVGDFCISLRSFQGGFEYSRYEGVVSTAYQIFSAIGDNLCDGYYRYLFKDKSFIDKMNSYTMTLRDGKNIAFDDFGNTYIPVPPKSEQEKIANFLDSKCSEIDAISADIQKEIETLEKYKRSVITETVTKGLNPEAEMKDSGAEWIGKVPTNWDLGRIGGFYSLRNEKVSDKDYPPLSVTMKGILPQLETAAKTNDGDNRKLVRKGDFAINSRSDRRGSCGISKYDGSVSLINTVLTPRGKMSAAYYDWVFHCTRFSDEFYRQGHGIVDDLWTTGWQEMKKIIIPVPPFLEQNEIADYLASKCSDIDSVISQKNQQLETLSNYKKILIYEYVTGKKEVLI